MIFLLIRCFLEEWSPVGPDQEEKSHPNCFHQPVQHPGSVMVWGWISVNPEKYTGVSEQHLLPSRPHLLQGRPRTQLKATFWTYDWPDSSKTGS